jgi:hypothetical protein
MARARFHLTTKLINALATEKAQGKEGQFAQRLMYVDMPGYLPFSNAGGDLLSHLQSKLYEHTSVTITIILNIGEWASQCHGYVLLLSQRHSLKLEVPTEQLCRPHTSPSIPSSS